VGKTNISAVMLGVVLACSSFSVAQSGAAEFFGMHINNHHDFNFWPDVQFSSVRLHDSGVSWREIEESPGKYNWGTLDQLLKRAKSHQVDALYDFVRTPEFYTSHSQCSRDFEGGRCEPMRCAKYGGKNQGGCLPPNDLTADGGGANQHFKAFVTALVDHVTSLNPSEYAPVTVWEIWNEFDRETFWQGTNPQLLRLAKDARAIIKAKLPNATITTPNATMPRFLREYLNQSGAPEVADAISLHTYVGQCEPEDQIERRLQNYNRLRHDFMAGKPIFVTEGSWGKPENCADLDAQAAFTARYLLLLYAGVGDEHGVDRLWWYAYDVPIGRLDDPDSNALRPSGIAYREVYRWLTENQLAPHSCKREGGSRWSCSLKKANGSAAMILWDADPGRQCAGGNCPTAASSVAGKFKQYRELTGTSHALEGQAPIGAKPILVEVGPAN